MNKRFFGRVFALIVLTERQRLFCNEYLSSLDAVEAALIAGYSKKGIAVAASRLMRVPKVVAYLNSMSAKKDFGIKENIAILLTERQQLFCDEYLESLNAIMAAKKAGYCETGISVTAGRLIREPKIVAYLDDKLKVKASSRNIDTAWVLDAALDLYTKCMGGVSIRNEAGDSIEETKFDSSGANRALVTIGKHVNIQAFSIRVDHNVNSSAPVLMWGSDGLQELSSSGPPALPGGALIEGKLV